MCVCGQVFDLGAIGEAGLVAPMNMDAFVANQFAAADMHVALTEPLPNGGESCEGNDENAGGSSNGPSNNNQFPDTEPMARPRRKKSRKEPKKTKKEGKQEVEDESPTQGEVEEYSTPKLKKKIPRAQHITQASRTSPSQAVLNTLNAPVAPPVRQTNTIFTLDVLACILFIAVMAFILKQSGLDFLVM
eukprot:CAMPEP_0168509682 /NCGR_PEP_ID=MMETSP0405-20121227/946_1 /TAXON_ID=498012 /ORGANISM="Trichosphaerium sp, Strain Am-I-7 wt" /LENGTH=188 /DNA_ID=CAMNT_0008527237 /DNA_START=1 /DNA_END=567 /DNA_ORIENTATION=+